ncbi:MAG TPA: SDR family NAD(P)-dependent oxidoreductase, partial [Streptosporangiaceae bacterium]
MERLQDRVAVVTGAGSGIGLASAKRMAAEGAKIVAVDIDEQTGKQAAEQTGGRFIAADVASEDDVKRLFDEVATAYGRIDIAFNNAGISPPDDDSILTTGIDAWRRVQEVNLTSVYLCCKYVIPHMQAAGKGSIINT